MNHPHLLQSMRSLFSPAALMLLVPVLLLPAGCGSDEKKQRDKDFSTSGSRDADQRAEQRIAKDQQIQGKSAEGDKDARINEKKPLYTRLGGDEGIQRVVNDWVDRSIADPRVNFTREGVRTGRIIKTGAKTWDKSAGNVAQLKKHYAQFIAVAAGGPPRYDGRDMKVAHAGMKISDAEFNATIGDLKATLDNLRIPTEDQKELLAIIESTRPQVVEVR